MKWMNKHELKYIAYSLLFGILWFFLIIPILIPLLDGDNPIIPFLVFNISIYAFFFIFLKSAVLKTKETLIGATGLISLFLATDILLPEYHIDFLTGSLIKGGILGISSSDYFFGWIAQQIGLTGVWVAIATYGVVCSILFLISAMSFKNFVREL